MEGRQIRVVLLLVAICCLGFQIRASDPVRCSNQPHFFPPLMAFLSLHFLIDCYLSCLDCRSFMNPSMSLSKVAGLFPRKTTIKVPLRFVKFILCLGIVNAN